MAQQTPKQILQTPLVGRSRKEARAKEKRISALKGIGGVGKTALAVKIAHRLLFPAAQLLVALRGSSENPALEPASIGANCFWANPERLQETQLDPLIAHMAKTLIGSNACWAPG